ncbi:Colicin V secretion protein CvaA [Flavobacterium bizetiae]|uniref:Colicin V secretion protein CvaA n=1 Tax=Flavobacterium bizetiae TaxID=2704140 RepID=A0A6J4GWJ6_9FLAO|nr:HlyD family efflux transporter periplasmic adaptor subunit [Flavobacterium bizetiae]CAA9203694.1 Colicin V secretion protein CvaA [Flavobacterium bizetiae]CAD5344934.1 Colicin V secretion protein CvaA [Flavobacterium bizetiae]CAD5350912.1 Colicin V secretion protein CvaA [Flavobacterium bizetiae]
MTNDSLPETEIADLRSIADSKNKKMPEEKEFEIRSEEVQEILSRVPHWMIRWGSFVVLIIILSLFFVSWLIKYPDTIVTQIVITTNIPPEKLVAKVSGKIEAILVEDKMLVSKNTPLAIIENSANYNDVFLLKSIVDTIKIDENKFPFEKLKSVQLGEIESFFASFQKESIADDLNTKLAPYQVEGRAENYEAIQLKERLNLMESQKSINQSELILQKNDLNRYETLYKKGIISTQEIEKQRLLFLQFQKNYQSVLSSISQLKSSINELNKNSKTTQINENKENVNLERNMIQAFYQLKKAIKDWELNYVLRSSIDGKVTFLQIWAKNQTVNGGENVFAIIPTNKKEYIGMVKAPAQNSGKVKVGQTVNIRLANYPDKQFGIVKGIIKAISLTPDKDGNLLIRTSLPNGLETSYKKQISFQQEMSGTADIVTEDLRLIERLLYQFRDIFKR